MTRPTAQLRWQKLGQVYRPPRDGGWRHAFAQVPTPVRLSDRTRIFFSVRPPREPSGTFTSSIAWVDVAPDDPTRMLDVASAPLLPPGKPGTFDEFGMGVSCCIPTSSGMWLYYSGWMRLVGVPYAVSIGLATSNDGGASFRKKGDGPLFGRTLCEPYQENAPYVLAENGGWRMWYGSGIDWLDLDGRKEAIYVIKQARSQDGINWSRDGAIIIPRHLENECQVRPTVWISGGHYQMLFSYRYGLDFRNPQRGYRIGYAYSEDGTTWHRDDDMAGLSPSSDGWDSEMVSYPCIYQSDGETLLFYNGNAFGENGFGVARLVT